MGHERVELDQLPGKMRLRVWMSGQPGGWLYREIAYGTFGVHGWYVHRVGRRWDGAWIVRDERACCELVDRWMRSATGWREIPADQQADPASADVGPR
jgi:hypothetical protein